MHEARVRGNGQDIRPGQGAQRSRRGASVRDGGVAARGGGTRDEGVFRGAPAADARSRVIPGEAEGFIPPLHMNRLALRVDVFDGPKIGSRRSECRSDRLPCTPTRPSCLGGDRVAAGPDGT